jgi:hypothetical protein
MQKMSEFRTNEAEPMQATSAGPTVAVLIADKSGATFFILPDPRFTPAFGPGRMLKTANISRVLRPSSFVARSFRVRLPSFWRLLSLVYLSGPQLLPVLSSAKFPAQSSA